MEYSINKLAKLSGISKRTLRYYDEIGLLSPKRIAHNAYRIYGQEEVNRLQRILFYRALDVPLDEIKQIVNSKDYDDHAALQDHLTALKGKREQLDLLIANVEKTIAAAKGEIMMSDNEKFKGLKQKMIDENEEKYGAEIRATYGDAAIDASNAKLMGMTPAQYESVQRLSEQVNEALRAAVAEGDPAGDLAQKACTLHKEWLCYYWNDYSKEAHLGLAQMYVDDARFKSYYDAIAEGGAEFLRDALQIYCN